MRVVVNICVCYCIQSKQQYNITNIDSCVTVIHVIFSWAQIGRSAIFGREIGVPDREIFSQQKKIKFNVKNCLFASA